MNRDVVVLGASGMLGRQVVIHLEQFPDLNLIQLSRSGNVRWDASQMDTTKLLEELELRDGAAVINASGWIPQKSGSSVVENTKSAELMNHLLPRQLDAYCWRHEYSLLQIGTDCVFSGSEGISFEDSNKDATDIYGVSKIQGERDLRRATTVRCSIIGSHGKAGLFNWFTGLAQGSRVTGYVNHLWNGVSTLAFAKLAEAWLRFPEEFGAVQHWLPADTVSKYELLRIFAEEVPRADITIIESQESPPRDMRLGTRYPERNARLWAVAGYDEVPTIRSLCREFINEVCKK